MLSKAEIITGGYGATRVSRRNFLTLGLADRQMSYSDKEEGGLIGGIVKAAQSAAGIAAALGLIRFFSSCDPQPETDKIQFLQENLDYIEMENIILKGNSSGVGMFSSLKPGEAEVIDANEEQLHYDVRILLHPARLPELRFGNPQVLIRTSEGKLITPFKHYVGEAGKRYFLAPYGNNTLIAAQTREDPVAVGGIFHYGGESQFQLALADIGKQNGHYRITKGIRFLIQGQE